MTRELVLGALGRAQRLYGMAIVCFVFLSNHFHLLLLPESALQLSQFMGHVLSNVAREVSRVHQWRHGFWCRRYRAIPVTNEESAQVERLRYLLSHGVKEGFVHSPRDWPGPQCVEPLLTGATITGTWYDRTGWWKARRAGLDRSLAEFATQELVSLTPLPCWREWPVEQRRAAVRMLLEHIELTGQIERHGREPVGAFAILRQNPHDQPLHSARLLAPYCHASTRRGRAQLREADHAFVAAFRQAADRQREIGALAGFPPGSFPSPLPFVPS
jgi:REP element-mobilizing transposase RayT